MSWFHPGGGWRVTLGDPLNGFEAEAIVNSPGEVAEWLRANAVKHSPGSEFAKRFPNSTELTGRL